MSWERRQGQGLHHDRRQGLGHRDGRLRPHRQGGRPRTAAAPPTTASASPPAAPSRRSARTRTAPGPRDASVAVCASAWSPAPTGRPATSRAYRHLAARTDLDAWSCTSATTSTSTRPASTATRSTSYARTSRAHEILTLADYRTRHGKYKTDADLQALHAAHRSSRSGTTTSSPTTPGRAGPRTTPRAPRAPGRPGGRRQAGVLRVDAGPHLHRAAPSTAGCASATSPTCTCWTCARSAPSRPSMGSGAVDDPERTITGRAQLDWLKSGPRRRPTRPGSWSATR